MASDPSFAATPHTAYASISTANTNRDGTGTAPSLIAGGSSGTRVDEVRFVAAGTTTAGVVRLFYSKDGGTTKRLLLEVLVTAITPSSTVAVWSSGPIGFSNLLLTSANDVIYASTHNAETFNVFATAGDF